MRYWVYINDKVTGPFEENKIAALEGFTPDTLICSEVIEEGAAQEWVPASSVLHISDAVTDNISERHLEPDPGISTSTYVAAKDVDIKAVEKTRTASKSSYISHEEMLLDKISKLSQEIEALRSEVRKLAERTFPSQAEDPLEKILTAAGGAAVAGKVMTHEELAREEKLKTEIKSIAEDNTPPEMDLVGSHSGAQKHAPAPEPEPELAPEPAVPAEEPEVKPEQTARPLHGAAPQDAGKIEDVFKEEKIVDSFPASSVLPELNDALSPAPEEKKEESDTTRTLDNALDSLFEPVKLQPIVLEEVNKDSMSLTQTLTGPVNTMTEEESAVVSSALDSLYRTSQEVHQPEPAKEPSIAFEDLIKKEEPPASKKIKEEVKPEPKPEPKPAPAAVVAPEPVKEAKPAPVRDATMVTQINNTMSEIQLGNEKTSLISDFIPPSGASEPEVKKQEAESAQEIVGGNFTVTETGPGGEPTLHQAPVIKRIKPADIKTNPLISASKAASAAPDTTEKIKFMDSIGTEEETTSAAPKMGAFRKIMVAFISFVLLLIILFGLMFAGIVPDVLGLFKKQGSPVSAPPPSAAPAHNTAPASPSAPPSPSMPPAPPPAASAGDSQVLMDVQNYSLPGGMTLMGLIASKYPMQAGAVEWSVKQIDAANYIVNAKVPPASDTSLMTIYRFNYVPSARQLTPLTSDSKNLLGVR